MKIKSLCISTLFAVSIAASSAFAQTAINLLVDNSDVRTNGYYTYYARGNGVRPQDTGYVAPYTPFTRAFYPGSPHTNETGEGKGNALRDGNFSDGGSEIFTTNGDKIRFDSGDLTNGVTTDIVGGWWGVTQITKTTWTYEGSFDILFDLSTSYVITSVEIVYTDTGSRRWSSTADIQKVYYAETLAGSIPVEDDFTIFGNGTTNQNTLTPNTLSIAPSSASGTSVVARYIDLRLTTQIVNNNVGAYGGYLHEIRINGYAIPEPMTWASIFGSSVLLAGIVSRARRSSKIR